VICLSGAALPVIGLATEAHRRRRRRQRI